MVFGVQHFSFSAHSNREGGYLNKTFHSDKTDLKVNEGRQQHSKLS